MPITLPDEKVIALRQQLARGSREQSASTRLLAVLSNEQIVVDWELDVVAVRGWLLRAVKNDESLLALVAANDSWSGLVAAAREHRERMADAERRRSAVVEKAAALVVGVVDASAGVLGEGVETRLGDAKARMILAVAGVEILRDLWEGQRTSTIVSASRLGAELGVWDQDISTALQLGVKRRVLATVSTSRSGGKRYRIASLPQRDYVAALGRYSDTITALVEVVTGARPSFLSMVQSGDLNLDGEWWAKRMERKAREHILEPAPPRGPVREVQQAHAGRVAAELLLTAGSPVWRGKGSSASLWLGMLRGVLGMPVSKHATATMVKGILGSDVFDRLNRGDNLADILTSKVTPEMVESARARMAAWEARSTEIREEASIWAKRKNLAEGQVTTWLLETPAPRWEDSTPAERLAFGEALSEKVPADSMGEQTKAFYAKRLARRLSEYRGWEKLQAETAARRVFGIEVARVDEPVELGNILV